MFGKCYCQQLNPEEWHERFQKWENPRFFYRFPTRLVMHNPITYNADISLGMMEAKSKGYLLKAAPLLLLRSGIFRGEVLIEIAPPKDAEESKCLRLHGSFYSHISNAPFTRMGSVIEEITRYLKREKKRVREIYLCPLTCPICAGAKGYNTVILAHLK